jgi:hypothetical protein
MSTPAGYLDLGLDLDGDAEGQFRQAHCGPGVAAGDPIFEFP